MSSSVRTAAGLVQTSENIDGVNQDTAFQIKRYHLPVSGSAYKRPSRIATGMLSKAIWLLDKVRQLHIGFWCLMPIRPLNPISKCQSSRWWPISSLGAHLFSPWIYNGIAAWLRKASANFGHFPTRKQASHRSNLEGSLIFLACPLELELRFTPDRLLLYEISLGSGLISPLRNVLLFQVGKTKRGLGLPSWKFRRSRRVITGFQHLYSRFIADLPTTDVTSVPPEVVEHSRSNEFLHRFSDGNNILLSLVRVPNDGGGISVHAHVI